MSASREPPADPCLINDKNMMDVIMRFIIVVQTVWFLVNFAQLVKGYTITAIDMTTVATIRYILSINIHVSDTNLAIYASRRHPQGPALKRETVAPKIPQINEQVTHIQCSQCVTQYTHMLMLL
jgi:hypothetical protein